jgi:hypothetical protein
MQIHEFSRIVVFSLNCGWQRHHQSGLHCAFSAPHIANYFPNSQDFHVGLCITAVYIQQSLCISKVRKLPILP